MKFEEYIRIFPDWPKKGVIFKDITPLLENPVVFSAAINRLAQQLKNIKVDKIAGIESRGFIFASAVAVKLNKGLVIVRKRGKLPGKTVQVTHSLEYGESILELHTSSIKKGERVAIFDDVLATGGTARAAAELVEKLGGKVVLFGFLIELTGLRGVEKLKGYKVKSLVKYDF